METLETTERRAWLSKHEACAYIGIGSTTLNELIRRGEIESARIGIGERRRTVRVSRASLEAYMRRNLRSK